LTLEIPADREASENPDEAGGTMVELQGNLVMLPNDPA
jgi:hypothetical protein